MRYLRKVDGKWIKEYPPDLNKWLIIHDGEEAVCICDMCSTYYCAMPVMMDNYREAWQRENKQGDPRKAKMFYDLARKMWQKEQS